MSQHSCSRSPRKPTPAVWLLSIWLLIGGGALAMLPGCGGCSRDDQQLTDEEKKQKEAEEKKKQEEAAKQQPFDKGLMKVMPFDDINLSPGVKQGHWVTVSQPLKANEGDFHGNLQFTPIDKRGVPIDLQDKPFFLNLSRPINLPKDQVKQIDMTLYAPPTAGNTRLRGGLVSQVGRSVEPAIEEFRPLAAHEYFFVVLAKEPDRYSHLQGMHWSRAPSGSSMQEETFYHVVRPNLDRTVPLSESALTWTGVAYVLWDKIDPALLNIEQQQAMLDWLHWGGQLIISGPDSLDLLRGSFLAPYLPAEAGEAVEWSADDLAELSEEFAPRLKSNEPKPLPVPRPWSGVELRPAAGLADDAVLVQSPTGRPLVVEQPTGRGRIVLTAFRLTQSELVNWVGYDGFFNACLLRRPPRQYELIGGAFNQVALDWQHLRGRRRDPRLITHFRLFSRDAGYEYREPPENLNELGGLMLESQSQSPSLGGWTDFSDTANAARDTLTEAAGIEIPDSGFVVRVLAIYLIIVVPVNWLFFRILGRVEWAWGAALVIAIAYAALVIRLAQLDIGFARSKTELAVLEVQPGYDRAHLTRYLALYTSLSSEYDLTFADRHALAQPFALQKDYIRQTGENSREVAYRQDKTAELNGYPVLSNRTGLVHTEQMIALDGSFRYTAGATASIAPTVTNGTQRGLRNAVLVGKASDSTLRVGWLGDLPSGAAGRAAWQEIAARELLNWYQQQVPPVADATEAAVPLNLIRLVDVGMRSGEFQPGDVRLVGILDDPDQQGLVSTNISPSSRQARYGAVVIAHLQYAARPAPRRDANSRQDFADVEGTVRPAYDGSQGLPPQGLP